MKTLGQVAWESQFCGGDDKGWQYEEAHVRSNWEEIGKAVRAAVIQECFHAYMNGDETHYFVRSIRVLSKGLLPQRGETLAIDPATGRLEWFEYPDTAWGRSLKGERGAPGVEEYRQRFNAALEARK